MAKPYVFWRRGDHMLGEHAGAFAIDKALALFTHTRKSKPVKHVRVVVVRWIDVSQKAESIYPSRKLTWVVVCGGTWDADERSVRNRRPFGEFETIFCDNFARHND
jgi:hypothetical protein